MINNADLFSQPSWIIFTKGADIFGHDCINIKRIINTAFITLHNAEFH